MSRQAFDIFQILKAETLDTHQRIEGRMPIFEPDFDLRRYCNLLERFYAFWTPIELKLLPLGSLESPGIDLESRLKGPLLAQDLRALGRDPKGIVPCPDLPEVGSIPSCLGCMYVAEGSTLGGQLISRRIESHLGLTAGSGGSFFSGYGDKTGARWVEFKSFVSAHAMREDTDEIVSAARGTFDALFDWLGKI